MVAWATKVEDSTTTARLLGGLEVLLDLVVGPVDQVGMVLPAEGRVMPPPVAVVLVGIAETEDTSNERAPEVSTTGTQNGRDTRFFCNCTPSRGFVSGWYDSHFPFSLSLAFLSFAFVCLSGVVSIAGNYWCGLSIRQVYTVDSFICPSVFFFLSVSRIWAHQECDGRILSCDARIMREKERGPVPFHKPGAGARADSDHDENEFEPDNDQGFLPTRLSVKRRVGSGQVRQVKARKNGSEMIDCLGAALESFYEYTWTATKGSFRGWT